MKGHVRDVSPASFILRILRWRTGCFFAVCCIAQRRSLSGRGWEVSSVAPRIVSDVSCVTRINDAIYFSWQAQYLLTLLDDTCCSAHCLRDMYWTCSGYCVVWRCGRLRLKSMYWFCEETLLDLYTIKCKISTKMTNNILSHTFLL